ncbi:M1 family metallopeptidase [Jejudonia soesokkakensis]|uniref:Aminopeptidase N n=1 Tax=Jejudonia soesokkakensis TaxID=1323432 RepID=A0ABW2MTE1_9FLAO
MRYLLFILIPIASFGQQTDVVDYLRIKADIQPNPFTKEVTGSIEVTFRMKNNATQVYLDAVNMDIRTRQLEKIIATYSDNKVLLKANFRRDSTYTAKFSYTAAPKQALYFTGDQIWTQGQGKYTSHWLPSLDDMNDKIEFDITYRIRHIPALVANGKLESFSEDPFGTKTYEYDMNHPMASYLVAFATGDFHVKQLKSSSGVPIELYYEVKDSAKVEATYRYSQDIFDFLETEIGVPYPWQNYKQVPVRDFLYAGMENTTCTIFSEAFLVDNIGFNDKNYVNVNAHELAHQWFGNLVTETSGTHHWLQEGFATYYALLSEKEVFGEDYFYWKLFTSAEQLKALSEEGKGESLLNPKASSLTFYEKGAWALHILRETIGDANFRTAIRNYLTKYQFKNVSTENFIAEVKAITTIDISSWQKNWLQQSAFQSEDAYQSLIKSPFINKYLELTSLRMVPLSEKKLQLMTALTFPNDYMGQEAIYQIAGEPISETLALYKKGFASDNLYVRQAIALVLETIPKELQADYESLLNDDSYVTREIALQQLFINSPENRKRYLDLSKEWIGFQNKNLRQMWLVLALVEPSYEPDNTSKYIEELLAYSSAEFSFEIREITLQYLYELSLWQPSSLKNVLNAATHHNWRFRTTAREILSEVLKNEDYKGFYRNNFDTFSENEQEYLNKVLTQ